MDYGNGDTNHWMLEDPLNCVTVKQGTKTGAAWVLQVEVTVTQDSRLSRTQRVTSERGRAAGTQRLTWNHEDCRGLWFAKLGTSQVRKAGGVVTDPFSFCPGSVKGKAAP